MTRSEGLVLIAFIVIFFLGLFFGGIVPENSNIGVASSTITADAPSIIPVNSISLSQIQLSGLVLSCAFPSTESMPDCYYEGDSQYALYGELTNNSSIPFQMMYLTVDVYDCPGSVVNSSCLHVGEDTNAGVLVGGANGYESFKPDITTEAEASVYIDGKPHIQKNLVWTYNINRCISGSTISCDFWNGFETIPSTP